MTTAPQKPQQTIDSPCSQAEVDMGNEKMVRGVVAELTPLSSRRSYRSTSANSSHLHLSAAEALSLRMADTLPQKILTHLAEGGAADRYTLSPYLLRLSGAGFAHYAPGPETTV